MPTETSNISFANLFEIEMEGWCFGIRQYQGEIYSGLVHAIIREAEPKFREAVINKYIFSVLDLAKNFSEATKHIISEKEIAFSILARLPHPKELNDQERHILAQIINPVDRHYGEVRTRLQKKWAEEATL